ncbi:MAG: ATP-binding cassette domain-containing protein [Planctomycetaceae bacterium]|nr:ATP-binding cassette domain-containing protein [Planctomycetaceae bacterium]
MLEANLMDARHLVKIHGGRRVVDGVSLQVNRGEIVALLGRNHSGKSTTLRLISGALKPDGGTVQLRGSVLTELPPADAVSGPTLLLLDEPFAGLDAPSREALKTRILGLAGKGVGVLFADHDVRGSLDFCDRAYVMSDGHIATSGSASGLLAPQ